MSNKKYTVYEMGPKDFVDVKGLRDRTVKNKKKYTDMDSINWLKISWLRYRKDDPSHIYYKYDKSEDFHKFKVIKDPELEEVYKAPFPICNNKKKDLKYLCEKGTIPEQYHPFYNSLL